MIRLQVGDLRCSVLDGGSLWLDGGAMFGVVPKPLWEKERAPDERNRIRLAMNVLLVEDGRRRVLVDTGAGTRWDEKARTIYRLSPKDPSEILAPAGVSPSEIDLVINTHLHFDHAGGNVVRASADRLEPAFPNAVHVVQAGELETARSTNERTRASYRSDDFEPLVAAGRIRLLDGDTVLDRHLEVRVAPGHTPHLQVVLVRAGESTVAFPSDLVPMTSHVRYPYIMGYDLEPLETLASKKRLLPEAAREGWTVVFQHDAATPVGVLVEREGRLEARRLELEG